MKPIAKNEEFKTNVALQKSERVVPVVAKTSAYKFHMDGLRETAESSGAFIMHLYKMKSEELWTQSGHHSFKDFCEKEVLPLMKVPVSLRRLYQLAEMEEVRASLPPVLGTIVQTESQSRALAKAAPKERAKIVTAVASEGKVTAKAITEKIAETKKEKATDVDFEEIIEDANGETVPKNIAGEFQRAEREGKDAVQKAQLIKNYLEADDLTTVEARALRETVKDLLAGLKTHLTKHVLCPKCAGKKCAVCSKRGFVSKHFATKGIGKKED